MRGEIDHQLSCFEPIKDKKKDQNSRWQNTAAKEEKSPKSGLGYTASWSNQASN
jgi:hypothetical protein